MRPASQSHCGATSAASSSRCARSADASARVASGAAASRRGASTTSASELYYGITKRYYGHDAGVCVVDDYIRHEWSFIGHFYAEFYVYQYATAFTASEALASRVKAGDQEAARKYLAFLSAGGSKYPIELLKDAGVDMTTDEPLDLTMRQMARVMDEMDAILDRRDAQSR